MSMPRTLLSRHRYWFVPLLLLGSACSGTDNESAPVDGTPSGALPVADGTLPAHNGLTPAAVGSETAVPNVPANPAPPGSDAPPVVPTVAGEPPAAGDPDVTEPLPAVPPATERGGTRVTPTTTLDPGRVVLRRLNRAEYDNTVRDLLGTAATPAQDGFPADDVQDGFDTIGESLVFSLLLAEKVEGAAGQLIDELLARPNGDAWRTRILVCEPTLDSAAVCYQDILSGFMKSAYRRPVSAEEVQERVSLGTTIQESTGDALRGLRGALVSVLMSPHFLYRVELGDTASAAATPLSDYELASRLSYFLWASMPDQQLFDAAEAQTLTPTGAALTEQIDRMLADPKAQGFIDSFAGQWLSTREAAAFSPDAELFPDFDDELRLAMAEETKLFFKALLDENQPLNALVLGKFSYVNPRLADHYDLTAADENFSRVSLEGSPRIGILTHESFLTFTSYSYRTSPVRRADWILEHLLCDPPPPAPPMVPALVDPVPDSAVTLREAFELHRSNPSCAACHQVMDPIGFALENFDAVGAYRTTDNGALVDATGQLVDGTPLNGVDDLAQAIAGDADYAICMAKQMLTYAIGRSFNETDAKAYAAGVGVPVKDGTWPDLVHAVVNSEAFLTRRGEAL